MITSFNFWNTDTTRQLHLGETMLNKEVKVKSHFYVLAGMDYTICLRREIGHCCLLCGKLNLGKKL